MVGYAKSDFEHQYSWSVNTRELNQNSSWAEGLHLYVQAELYGFWAQQKNKKTLVESKEITHCEYPGKVNS